MSGAIDFMLAIVSYLAVLAMYLTPGGIVFAATRNYLRRNTKLDKDELVWAGVGAGVFWPITVPWFLLARMAGSMDPITRNERAAALERERLQREEAVATARARAQAAAYQEDLVTRKRARLAGEEIPYTEEERQDLALMEARAEKARMEARAIEAKVVEEQRYRRYS